LLEKLHFVNCYNFGLWLEPLVHFGYAINWLGLKVNSTMRRNLFRYIASIQARLKNLNYLFSDYCPLDAPNKLFGFTTKHTTTNDFDPAATFVPTNMAALQI